MKIFKLKYLFSSLIIHTLIISFFLVGRDSFKEAETTILITEIINISEPKKKIDFEKIEKSEILIDKEEKVKIEKSKSQKDVKTSLSVKLKSSNSPINIKSFTEQNMKPYTHAPLPQTLDSETVKEINFSSQKKSDSKVTRKRELSKAIYKIGSVNNPHPPYPIIARKKGLQGKLILSVIVNNDGSVKNVSIRESSGHLILDRVSKETIEKWIFTPAKIMGKTVVDNIQVPIRFVLTE
tara:strand:- start:60 stop:773 length:714 start_codon:yes stop_codon:yes gene_type:complete